ncbi:hypothetical protein [Sphingopyxis kveilinensis]|uniref:hypothetical protein n=1 Tax=Sphingopyxis kveilinensis TaxID=3114367 RepID=UPI0030D61F9A
MTKVWKRPIAAISRIWHSASVDAHDQWLDSERQQKRRSANFSLAMLLSPPLLALIVLSPAVLVRLDGTSNTTRTFYAVYLTLALIGAFRFARKRFAVGSIGRYTVNFIAIALGIFAPLMVIAALRSVI